MRPFVRSQYNYDTKEASDASALICEDESRTQQHQKEEADINTIVKRFALTGQLPKDVEVPRFVEFEDVVDFHTAMTMVKKAEQAFMLFPAEVRQRFNHSPQNFIDFIGNPDNLKEATDMGVKPSEAKTDPVGDNPIPEPPKPS